MIEREIKTEALRLARNAVRAQIKARGERLKDYEHSQVEQWALAWFKSHRAELIGLATLNLLLSDVRNSKHLHKRSRSEKSTASAVQISGAK
jgi:hypothetical protein